MNNISKVLQKLIHKKKKQYLVFLGKFENNFVKKLITVQFILISVKGYARKKENRRECYTFRKDYFIILDMDYLTFHERQLVLVDIGLPNPVSV